MKYDTNNFEVNEKDRAVVLSTDLNSYLWDKAFNDKQFITIDRDVYWLTTVGEAMKFHLTCARYDERYGILNSVIKR